jgi:hypothetical protein
MEKILDAANQRIDDVQQKYARTASFIKGQLIGAFCKPISCHSRR